MSSAFTGILAYGFMQMNGLGDLGPTYGHHNKPTKANPRPGIQEGISGWRWIFIMQGILTVVIGFIGALFIVDFPEKAANKSSALAVKFLNEKEVAFVVARIEKDRHDAIPEKFRLKNYLAQAWDIKIWGFATLFMCTTTNTYAIAYFLPIILRKSRSHDHLRLTLTPSQAKVSVSRSPKPNVSAPRPTSSPPSSCTVSRCSPTNTASAAL